MASKLTIVVMDQGVSQAKLTKCLASLSNQTQPAPEIMLITPKATAEFDAVTFKLVQPATVPFKTVVKLANQWATGDYITFLSANNFYLKEDALATCLTELTAKQADMGVANLVTLVDGTFQFKANPTNEVNNPQGGVIYLVHGPLAAPAKQALIALSHWLVYFRVELLPLSPVDQHLLAQISLASNHLPRSAYYRILLPNLLPEVDRVLYLDYDTLVLGDLTTLWHSDLAGNFLGCIRDQGVTIKNGWAKNLFGPDANNYFNSGVLLMDLALLRKYGVTGYFYQFILESTKFFVLGDQDAYNLYFKDAVQYLPIENNYVTQLLESSDPAEHRELAKVTILHFLSAKKPWKDTTSYPAAMLPAMRTEYQLAKQVPQLTVLVLVDDEHDLARCLESIYYPDYPNLAATLSETLARGLA